ncbi:carotenoid oxygenase family protein [Embleya hyalina]|uniref:Dioxygenase n=1 Tax=Embleya hyalina TaxID=516124 RepID=A0A401Z2M3_9ACTN|nr:carotenoid oxygenase family protein [Embleya hyalina]GCE01089.1 carotenoid cleavage dioxygenase [Embleya hyalina]
MTTPAPHLVGNFAPVVDELTSHDLPVTGSVPRGLTGWYLRNGPNPHEAASAHWFLGSGMVHGVRLEAGRATSYRNRWVRNSTFTDDAMVYDELGNRDLTAGASNTSVVRHAGRVLALSESTLPYLLTPELDTAGAHDFGGKLRTAMTAHPKTCPTTGELHFFGCGMLTAPYLTYHRTNAAGELTVSRDITGVGSTMMHDFALTAEHVVFMDLPVVFDVERAISGLPMPYRWDPSYAARLGVLRRDDPHGEVRWFDIDPCYVFHVPNAHDEGDGIVLSVIRYPELWRTDSGEAYPVASLWRWTVNLTTGKVTEEQLDDRNTEFPRIDDRLAGLDARHVHTVVAASHPRHDPVPGALLRYDMHTGSVTEHTFGPGRIPSEAAFAPADDRPGGEGWLMTFVYDASTDKSDLVIVDAGDLGAPPVATIHLPQRVPYGFHGSWLPDPGTRVGDVGRR